MPDDWRISDHGLERFILGMIEDEWVLEPMEEHVLVCAECIERADHHP